MFRVGPEGAALATEDLGAELETTIYEAAFAPDHWPAALQTLGQLGGAAGSVLFSVTEWSSQWTACAALRPAMQDFVELGWAARNTRMSNGLRKGLHLQPHFITEADYYEGEDIETDALNQEFFRPRGLGHSAGTIAQLPHGDMLCYSLERRWNDGPVPGRNLDALNAVRPHLVRAASIAARLGFERTRTAVDTLASIGYPAAAVTGMGRVVIQNALADGQPTVWTTGLADRLVLHDRGASQMLAAALQSIGGTGGLRSIPVRGEDGIVRHVLHVVPVRRSAHDIFSAAAAIVLLMDAVDKGGSPALLQALFDMTASEARLARQLADGQSLEQIAMASERSVMTVRTQLRSVFDKVGVSRQADLVRVLTRLVPPGL